MKIRGLATAMVALIAAACTIFGPGDASSIAGQYDLATVNGQALPCCTLTDSTGQRMTYVGGSLTLSEARPERFDETPAGAHPHSCVHEIPNGAHVDTAGVVKLPDGSTYQLPKCGNGTYTLVIAIRYDDVDGASRTVADTSAGRYAWDDGANPIVSLLDDGLSGGITTSQGSVNVTVAARGFGMGPGPTDARYGFSRVTN